MEVNNSLGIFKTVGLTANEKKKKKNENIFVKWDAFRVYCICDSNKKFPETFTILIIVHVPSIYLSAIFQ